MNEKMKKGVSEGANGQMNEQTMKSVITTLLIFSLYYLSSVFITFIERTNKRTSERAKDEQTNERTSEQANE